MLCPLCKGTGNLVTFSPLLWWMCQVCVGAGVSIQYGPAEIHAHPWRDKFAKKKGKSK